MNPNVPVQPVAPLPPSSSPVTTPPSSPTAKTTPLVPNSPVANGKVPVEGANAVDRLDTLVKGDGPTASASHNINNDVSLKGQN